MRRSQLHPGDLIEYRCPTYHHEKAAWKEGRIKTVPTDPASRIVIQSPDGRPISRALFDIRPAKIPDDQCPECYERPTACLFSRNERKIPVFYCYMCAKSYEPKGQLIMKKA